MGHKRIDETMIYVHVAENHRREIPEAIMAELDPDRRVLAMLGARGSHGAVASRNRKRPPKQPLEGGDKGDRTQSAHAEILNHLASLQ